MGRRSQFPGWAVAMLAVAGLGCGGARIGGEDAPSSQPGATGGRETRTGSPVSLVAEIPSGRPANRPPRFLSRAPGGARAGAPYRYGPLVVDPDGDEVRLRLVRAPEGARLEGTLLVWTPRRDQAGRTQTFTLRAVDEHGAAGEQTWRVIPQGEGNGSGHR